MSARHNYFAYFLWTGEDAARLYGVNFDTIKRAINAGDLKAKRVGRLIRVSDAALAGRSLD